MLFNSNVTAFFGILLFQRKPTYFKVIFLIR